jgi:hypothetical protein
LQINKTVIVASSWCSIFLYLQWWCTVKHKSSDWVFSKFKAVQSGRLYWFIIELSSLHKTNMGWINWQYL